jgi:hypothetical protein
LIPWRRQNAAPDSPLVRHCLSSPTIRSRSPLLAIRTLLGEKLGPDSPQLKMGFAERLLKPRKRGERRLCAWPLGLAVAGVALTAAVATATPAVTWSPSSVSVTLAPGQTQTATATFNALETLGDVSIRVVPSLAGLVAVAPAQIAGVQAGRSVQLTLTFAAAPSAVLGMFDGTLQVRATPRKGGKGSVFARPLPLTVTVRQDPLVGTDADGDGVWDYIGHYISQTYGETDTANALKRLARTLQEALLVADDPVASVDKASQLQRKVECLYFLRPADAYRVISDFTAASLNTLERSRAYVHFGDQLGGQVFPSTPLPELGSTCNP